MMPKLNELSFRIQQTQDQINKYQSSIKKKKKKKKNAEESLHQTVQHINLEAFFE